MNIGLERGALKEKLTNHAINKQKFKSSEGVRKLCYIFKRNRVLVGTERNLAEIVK
jgi:hypothetical protein